MEFQTKYGRPDRIPEENSGINLVETAGYVPAKKRIESLISAGLRLRDYRENSFDIQADQELDWQFDDPTRSPGYDMADAFQDSLAVTGRLKAARRAQSEAKASKNASKMVSDTSEPPKKNEPSEG